MLKRQGVLETWHDRRILAGQSFKGLIDEEIERADIILLLVSPDFWHRTTAMRSRWTERSNVTQRAKRLSSRSFYAPASGRKLRSRIFWGVPKDGKPVTKHADLDDAMLDISNAITELLIRTASKHVSPALTAPVAKSVPKPGPRSSNLGLKKTYTESEKDKFLDEGFEYIANFFENSLPELHSRNAEIESRFKRIDSAQFTAVIYRSGAVVARCRIFIGAPMMTRGVAYANDDSGRGNASMRVSV